MYPEFTKYEQYIIAYYRADRHGLMREVIWAEATYLLPVVVIFALAAYTESWLLSASAAVVYIGFKLREALWEPAGRQAMASIITKYDETIAELNRKLAGVAPSSESAPSP